MLLSVESKQGKRNYMEDRYAYFENPYKKYLIAFVCDGHGGDQMASITIDILLNQLKHGMDTISNTIPLKIALRIREIIVTFGEKYKKECSGSTLTGIVQFQDYLFIFNIGDSRTLFKTSPNTIIHFLRPYFCDITGHYIPTEIKLQDFITDFFITNDHDDSNIFEVERIYKSGGTISNHRLNGILSVTRSFGDYDIGKGICYIPDIYWTSIKKIEHPILLISDGIYEHQRSHSKQKQNAEEIYNKAMNGSAKKVVQFASQSGSSDNLTAMVVSLIH